MKTLIAEFRRIQAAPHFYAVLGTHAEATRHELQARRKELAQELHPDRHGNDARAGWCMAEVNRAHDVLCSKVRARAYRHTLGGTDCSKCKGRGCTVKQRGFHQAVKTVCAACLGSGIAHSNHGKGRT